MADHGSRPRHESPGVQLGVGLFVAIAAVGFVWLLVAMSRGPERYPLIAEFDMLGGINEATKVKLRGFTVGQVDAVEFWPLPPAGEAHFLVTLGIERGYPVPSGAVAEIRGSGLVGEAFIDLDVADADGPPLAAGAHLTGRSDDSMKTLMTKLREAAEKLGGAGASIRDAELGERLRDISASVADLSRDMSAVSSSADSLLLASRHIVVGMEPGLARSLGNLDRTLASLAGTMGRTDTLIAATGEDVRTSVQALRRLVERLDAVAGRVDSVVLLKQAEIDETLENVHAASAAVRELSEHPWRLVVGRGDGRVAEEMAAPAADRSPERDSTVGDSTAAREKGPR